MKVYILTGWVQYEGDWILGVYSTKELAEAASEVDRVNRKKEQRFDFDRYDVQDYEVDAK